jgi:hypothetical protein
MPTLVAVVGDLHVNSTVALCPPSFNLDDGGTYRASKPQRWIWRQWREYWNEVELRRAAIGGPLVVILNGELADDNHHPTTQLITRNHADMLRLSVEALKPMLDLSPDAVYVIRGTEAHAGPGSWLDEAIAQDVGAKGEGDTASHYRLRLQIDGVRFDVAHHPPGGGGRRPWTRANFAATLASMAVFDAAEREERPPHLYIRGHVHRPVDSYDAFRTRAIVLPSWQLTTSYGHKLGGDPLPIGGGLFVCERGDVIVSKFLRHWPVEGYQAV